MVEANCDMDKISIRLSSRVILFRKLSDSTARITLAVLADKIEIEIEITTCVSAAKIYTEINFAPLSVALG